jgi:transposase
VDVGLDTLDARIGRDGPWQPFPNSPDGRAALAAFCREHDVALVAMEATGGYERPVFGALWAEGVPAAIVNPRAVRRFAEGMGVLEKTDRIDCGIIAWYAQTKGIGPTPPAAATQARLTALAGPHLPRFLELDLLLEARHPPHRTGIWPSPPLSPASRNTASAPP